MLINYKNETMERLKHILKRREGFLEIDMLKPLDLFDTRIEDNLKQIETLKKEIEIRKQ